MSSNVTTQEEVFLALDEASEVVTQLAEWCLRIDPATRKLPNASLLDTVAVIQAVEIMIGLIDDLWAVRAKLYANPTFAQMQYVKATAAAYLEEN